MTISIKEVMLTHKVLKAMIKVACTEDEKEILNNFLNKQEDRQHKFDGIFFRMQQNGMAIDVMNCGYGWLEDTLSETLVVPETLQYIRENPELSFLIETKQDGDFTWSMDSYDVFLEKNGIKLDAIIGSQNNASSLQNSSSTFGYSIRINEANLLSPAP